MKCIETYDGSEYWISNEKAVGVEKVLTMVNPPKMIKVDGSMIVVNNIAGIKDELDMKEKEYRKRGMYVCEYMRWHEFKEKCNCRANFKNYGIFENPWADIKSKQLLEYEKLYGKLELNLDENDYPIRRSIGDYSAGIKSIDNSQQK